MHYLIDGYNLLFHISDSEDFSSSREALIKELNQKAIQLNWDLTLIFDAPGRPMSTRTHYQNLEILYSGNDQSADQLIIMVLKRLGSCGDCTVVTSDNRLALKARNLGAKSESVKSFLTKLNKKRQKRVEVEKEPELPRLKRAKETDFERWFRLFEERFRKGTGA